MGANELLGASAINHGYTGPINQTRASQRQSDIQFKFPRCTAEIARTQVIFSSRMAILLLSVFVLFDVSSCIQARISVSICPQQENYNVPLDPNLSVQFNCTSTAANIEWRVNDTIPRLGSELENRGVVTSAVTMIAPGKYFSSLNISARSDNNNTRIMCRAIDSDQGSFTNSREIFLAIQGLLDAPPNVSLSDSEADGGLTRVLSWDMPASLDITDIDPDIQSYQICYMYSISGNPIDTCISVSSSERREFRFVNVRVPLLFTVTAINVVGEGPASSIIHQPTGCDNRGRPT